MVSKLFSSMALILALTGSVAFGQAVTQSPAGQQTVPQSPAVQPAAPVQQPAVAAPPPATKSSPVPAIQGLTAEQARRAIETLENDARRSEVLNALRAITATGAAPAKPAQKAGATPAATAAPQQDASPGEAKADGEAVAAETKPAEAPKAAPKEEKAAIPLQQDGLLVQLATTASDQIAETSRAIASAAQSITLFPVVWSWFVTTIQDPVTFALLLDVSWKLAIVFGSALAVGWVITRFTRRAIVAVESRIPSFATKSAATVDKIKQHENKVPHEGEAHDKKKRRLNLTRVWQSVIRLPFVLARLLLELLPVTAFAMTSIALLGTQIGNAGVTRLAIEYVVNAYLAYRIIVCIMRALFGPYSLFAVREDTSAYIELWTRRIIAVSAAGIALAKIATLLGLEHSGYVAMIRVVMLVAHLMLVMVILQCRRPVADMIRAGGKKGGIASAIRSRIANFWHVFAIGIVMALWAVWALSIRDGYSLVIQYVAGSVLVLLATRLISMVALGLLDRTFQINPEMSARIPGLEQRANLYLPLLRRVVSIVISAIGIVVLLQLWGFDTLAWFTGGQIGSKLASAAFTISIAVVIAVIAWEGVNGAIDRKLEQLSQAGQYASAARLRTFRPMVRTTLLGIIIAIVGLTALSEIGVNVAPLLAGAGILGVAIGFGSQRLVQELITGLFLLIENVVQVGDNVTVSGLTGTVENLSIRTIRLRAGDGSVHIVPFSAVTTITNASRGAGNAVIRVDVDRRNDPDHVGAILQQIAKGMRSEPEFSSRMRSDFELWGVDKIEGSLIQIAGQIRCTDSGKSPVLREFNRRMKLRFDEEGIVLAGTEPNTIVVQRADEITAPVIEKEPEAVQDVPKRRAQG